MAPEFYPHLVKWNTPFPVRNYIERNRQNYRTLGEPELLPFEPAVTCEKEYPITTYQPTYFVTESFEDAKLKLKEFAKVKSYTLYESY